MMRFVSRLKNAWLRKPLNRMIADLRSDDSRLISQKVALKAFAERHVGADAVEIKRMLDELGFDSREDFERVVFTEDLVKKNGLINSDIQEPISEQQLQTLLVDLAEKNGETRSFVGQGYYGTCMPEAIRRYVLENPLWYTPYTPYQPEISQGRLEALFNYQTMIQELTGFPIANASLLDEASAAAEAMSMLFHACKRQKKIFLIGEEIYPSTISCLKLRAEGLGIKLQRFYEKCDPNQVFGALMQYPSSSGSVEIDETILLYAKKHFIPVACATDLMALTLLKPPGQLGFDVAFGSSQRFGMPLGFGGPHAGFFSCRSKYLRMVPGRIVGLSKDSRGIPAYRLALQTREQHIKREGAFSNICTAQALPAVISSFYALYHGPSGLRSIAEMIQQNAIVVADVVGRLGLHLQNDKFFDTLVVMLDKPEAESYHKFAADAGMTFRRIDDFSFGISIDETISNKDVLLDLIAVLAQVKLPNSREKVTEMLAEIEPSETRVGITSSQFRQDIFMGQSVFNRYNNETSLMRYIFKLCSKDYSLVNGIIPLGSCTMKLNSAVELRALSMNGFANIHPHTALQHAKGYETILSELRQQISAITGFPAVSLQPNSGAQGEYLVLSMIRKAFRTENREGRTMCLVPTSAHGTNAASAAIAGFQVVPLKCTKEGRIDTASLAKVLAEFRGQIAVIMVTYPSTFGVFDESILESIQMARAEGIYVYLDGANMNAMTGYTRPVDIGADACHLNLHKTFSIPHGGGGPGAGPIGV